MTNFNAQDAEFKRREQELKAREQEIRLKELELEIQRLEDPATPVPEADYSPTRKHVEKPGFMQRFSRKAKLAVKLVAFAALGIAIIWIAQFVFWAALILAVGAVVYLGLFEKNSKL